MSEYVKWSKKLVPYNIFFQVQDEEGRPFKDLEDMTFHFNRVYPTDLLYTPRLHPEVMEAIEKMCEYISQCDDDVVEAADRVRTYLNYAPEE